MAIGFSIEELRGILLEAGLDAAAARTLAATINGPNFGDDLEEHLAAQLRGRVSPEVLERALAQATREAKRIAGNLLQAELNKIAEKLAQNLAAGKSPEDLARLLNEIKGLDKNRAATYENYKALLDQLFEDSVISVKEYNEKLERMYQKLLRDRKKTIAATEQRMATSEANRIIAESRGQQFKVWITVGDDRVSKKDRANEAKGWIPIDEAFPSGDQQPPSHPNCRCTVAYRTSEPDEQAKERARERARNTKEAAGAAQE